MDKATTVSNLIRSCSVSIYMDDVYWTPRHKQLALDADFENKLKEADHGDDTLKLLLPFKLSIYNLMPGKECEFDMTKRYYTEVLMNHPIIKILEVTDLDEPASASDLPASDVDLTTLDEPALIDLALLHNVAVLERSRESLIKDLHERGIGVEMQEEEVEELQKMEEADIMTARVETWNYKKLQKEAKSYGVKNPIGMSKIELQEVIIAKLQSNDS